jgi:hypothetical protein
LTHIDHTAFSDHCCLSISRQSGNLPFSSPKSFLFEAVSEGTADVDARLKGKYRHNHARKHSSAF